MSSEPKSADKLQAEIAREYRNFKPSDEVRQLAEELFASEPCEATPDHVLRTQVMDSRIPKNEREWWAKREIESQQARIGALEQQLKYAHKGIDIARGERDEKQARIQAALEVYAGMEGFIPETAAEGYCLRIIEQMNKALLEEL